MGKISPQISFKINKMKRLLHYFFMICKSMVNFRRFLYCFIIFLKRYLSVLNLIQIFTPNYYGETI